MAVTVCLKLGGETIAQPALLDTLARDIAKLHQEKRHVFIVHGAGPQINVLSERLGLTPQKVGGRRITDAATLEAVIMAQGGTVNATLCGALVKHGLQPVGISGWSGPTVLARRRPPKAVSGSDGRKIDFGFVGDIKKIQPQLLRCLLKNGFIPVLSSLGMTPQGQPLNLNADGVAARLAASLKVNHFVMVTNVPGVLRDPSDPKTRIPSLTCKQSRQLIHSQVITGGMIPKVEEAFQAIRAGIQKVHILSPNKRGVLPSAIRQPGSCGTVLS